MPSSARPAASPSACRSLKSLSLARQLLGLAVTAVLFAATLRLGGRRGSAPTATGWSPSSP